MMYNHFSESGNPTTFWLAFLSPMPLFLRKLLMLLMVDSRSTTLHPTSMVYFDTSPLPGQMSRISQPAGIFSPASKGIFLTSHLIGKIWRLIPSKVQRMRQASGSPALAYLEQLINCISGPHLLDYLLQVVWDGTQEYISTKSSGDANALPPHTLRPTGHQPHSLLVSSRNHCSMVWEWKWECFSAFLGLILNPGSPTS